jgi:hypothetical protein
MRAKLTGERSERRDRQQCTIEAALGKTSDIRSDDDHQPNFTGRIHLPPNQAEEARDGLRLYERYRRALSLRALLREALQKTKDVPTCWKKALRMPAD